MDMRAGLGRALLLDREVELALQRELARTCRTALEVLTHAAHVGGREPARFVVGEEEGDVVASHADSFIWPAGGVPRGDFWIRK